MENNGLSGLVNLGNTCFINSLSQCLSHTIIFNDFLDNDYVINKDYILLNEWNSLRTLMWKKNCIISPKRFISYIHKVSKSKNNDVFSSFTQNDVDEFLYFLLNTFHEYLSISYDYTPDSKKNNNVEGLLKKIYKNEHSKINNLFQGIQLSVIMDENKTILCETPDLFYILELTLSGDMNNDIEHYIKNYTSEEYLCGDNKYQLDNGTYKNARKLITFYKLPPVLIITLKRFSNNIKKIKIIVRIKEYLDVLEYKSIIKYELYAVCLHMGEMEYGHYVSCIKNNNNWYIFNDEEIYKTKFSDIESNSNIYCLFYKKCE